MKKLLTLTAIAFAMVLSVSSQEKKAKWIGGTLQMSSRESGNLTNSSTTLMPEMGVHLSSNWAVGGKVGFSTRKDDRAGGGTEKFNAFSIVPFARYHFASAGKFLFFGQGELPLRFEGGKNIDGSSKDNNNSIGLRVRPGLSFAFNDKWGFNMLMPSVFSFVNGSNENSSVYFGINDGYNIQDYLLDTSIGFVYMF